ncbi:MAG: hypothetical protein ACLQBD_09185 [Syntrophobacteraceae bacterium]
MTEKLHFSSRTFQSLAEPMPTRVQLPPPPPKFVGSFGKRVPAQFTGEEGDCKNVIPAKAGIQEGWLGVAKQFFV